MTILGNQMMIQIVSQFRANLNDRIVSLAAVFTNLTGKTYTIKGCINRIIIVNIIIIITIIIIIAVDSPIF